MMRYAAAALRLALIVYGALLAADVARMALGELSRAALLGGSR